MLNPVYYAVSGVMWVWHQLFSLLLGPSSGLAWALSVVFLVITLRAVMLRPFVNQMRSARRMRALSPQLKALRERHRNDKLKLAEETRKLQSDHGVNLFASFLPLILQLPVFIGLLHVLRSFNRPGLDFEQNAAIANYAFPPDQVRSFLEARLFGTPLSAYVSMPQDLLDSFGAHVDRWEVYAVAVPLMLLAAVATHFSARHSLEQQEATGAQVLPIMRWTPWIFPLGALATGLFFPFPVAVLLYWLGNNVWTLGQQRLVHRYLERRPEPVPVKAAPAVASGASRVRPGAKPVRPGARPVSAAGPGRAGLSVVHPGEGDAGVSGRRTAGVGAGKPRRNSSGHRPSRRRR